jgi:hypothetical protein
MLWNQAGRQRFGKAFELFDGILEVLTGKSFEFVIG